MPNVSSLDNKSYHYTKCCPGKKTDTTSPSDHSEHNVWMTFITALLNVLLCVNLQEVNFMVMEASKGDILAGFQKLFGNIFIPALQKQEVIAFY